MPNTDGYFDKHGVQTVFPVSFPTLWRLCERKQDPFPRGKIIGGKRYWLKTQVLEWLHRQDDDPRTTSPAFQTSQSETADPPAAA